MRRIRQAGLPAVVLALTVLVTLTSGDSGDRALWPVGWALIVAGTVPLYWRQRWTLAVLVVTAAAALLYYPLGFPGSPVALGFVIALYTLVRDGRRVVAIGAAVALTAVTGVRGQVQATIGVAALLALTVALGEVARGRIRHVELAASEASLAERMRIARDLHDVLAHQVSLINVQAGAALHTRDPGGAFAALEAIRSASGEALREVRTVLGVLRQADEPPPSLAALPALLARTEAAGLPVRSAGDVPRLPMPVDLAAYRIVQEALTNAVRHASATSAGVDIRCGPGEVVVTVDDDGHGPLDPLPLRYGNGLRGMAERVAAVGGELQAGPGPDGGFRVRARLPVDPV